MDPSNSQQHIPFCPSHPDHRVEYYNPSPAKNNHSLCCAICVQGQSNEQSFINLSSYLSDEAFISFQGKLATWVSSFEHNNVVSEFIDSVFKKLQVEMQANLEKAKKSLLTRIQGEDEEKVSVDALKIEIQGRRDELLASDPQNSYEKIEQFIKRISEVDQQMTQAQEKKVSVPILNHDEFERFLANFKNEIQAFSFSIFNPPKSDAQIDKDILQKKAMLQEKIPGLITMSDKVMAKWFGKQYTPQNIADLQTFLTYSTDISRLKLIFGKFFVWGSKGSNITDSDLEDHILPPVFQMKKLQKLRLNLTKTFVTNKCLKSLKKIETLPKLKKIFISVYSTPITAAESKDLFDHLKSKLPNTKITVRDADGLHWNS